MSSCETLTSILHLLSQFGNGCGRLSRENKFLLQRSRDRGGQGSCCTHRRAKGGSRAGVKWRAYDIGEAKEWLENKLWRRWSNGRIGEWTVTYVKRRKGWKMSCDVGEVTEMLENEQSYLHFSHFTYVTIHSPTLSSLYLRHISFSNHSIASPTSQFILQPFFRFSYVTNSSLNFT